MKLFRNKKTRYRNLILVLLPFIIIAGVCTFFTIKSASSIIGGMSGQTDNDRNVIKSMDYHLRKDATDLQIELFDELAEAIKDGTDKRKISGLIAENFVADFYTWTNKEGSYDIGGMYYVYTHSKINIYKQARNQYYKYVTYYKNKYGSDKLLEVESISAEVGDEVLYYERDGRKYEYYFVTCEWKYKDGSALDASKFVTKEHFSVIFNTENNRYEIVQAYGDE